MKEIWKDIEGYEGIYQVSNLGRVKSVDHYDNMNRFWNGKIRKLSLDGKGNYFRVGFTGNKFFLVHRLVAKAFISNPDNKPEVNHKDQNKTNNCADNLEWCNRSYNNAYGGRSRGEKNPVCKLTEAQVKEIRERHNNGERTRDIAKDYNVSDSRIADIYKKRTWGWLK